MDSKVGSFAVKDMVCVDMESTVIELIKVLAKVSFTAVPVLDNSGNCFGIVSAMDVFRLISSHENFQSVKAWEVCSHKVIYVSPDMTAIQACQVMRENDIHHLIVGDAGKPTGIISTMDIVDRLHRAETPKGYAKPVRRRIVKRGVCVEPVSGPQSPRVAIAAG